MQGGALNGRIEYFDVAKGGLIALLIFHHFFCTAEALSISSPSEVWKISGWQTAFLPFFMQTFFFISGFCSTFDKPCVEFLKAQARQLLLPIVVFSLILSALNSVFYVEGYVWYTWDYFLYGEVMKGSWFWFLDALLFSKLLVYFLNKGIKNKSLILVVLFFVMLAGFLLRQEKIGYNYFHLWQGMGSAFFVGLGAWAKEHRSWYEKALVRCSYAFPWLLILLVLCHVRIPVFTAPMNVELLQIPVFLILSLTGSFAFLYYAKKLHRYLCFFNYWGRNTLVIYCFNSYFLLCVVDGVFGVIRPETNGKTILFMAASFLAMALLSSLAVYLFNTKYLCWAIGRFRLLRPGACRSGGR